MDKSYPAEAALVERRGRRARAESALSLAQTALSSCERALAALESSLPLSSAGPRSTVSGFELAREAAFRRRCQVELEAARAALHAQQRRVAQARGELSAALADERVVERDRARHEAAQRRQAERVEELEVEELVSQRRPRQ